MDALRADDDRVDLINNGIRPRDHLHVYLSVNLLTLTHAADREEMRVLCPQMRAHTNLVAPHFKLRWCRGPPALTLFSGRVPINNALLDHMSWGLAPSDHLTKC